MKKATLIILTLTLAACCPVMQQTADTITIGINAADELLPPEADTDLEIAHGIADMGQSVARDCVSAEGWAQWVVIAAEAVGGLIALFQGAADETPEVPAELLAARDALEGEL